MKNLALLAKKRFRVLEKNYNSVGKNELSAVIRVMQKGTLSGFLGRAGKGFLGGEEVRRLEADFQRRFNVKYAVSFNSASSALQAAVYALGLKPGQKVITTPFTMSASASAILFNNALPIFADINSDDFCIDSKDAEKNVDKKTKALLVVNLFGGPANFYRIKKFAKLHDLKIIEDNAQAIGAKYKGVYAGTIGDIGVFSFNVHKIIHSGEGGMLVTNNDKYAFRAQLFRNHGEVVIDDLAGENIFEPILGGNYRMTEITAAIARKQLKKMPSLISARTKNALYLKEMLGKFKWLRVPVTPSYIKHVYYAFPVIFKSDVIGISRKTFADAMSAEGYPLYEGYTKPIYLYPLYQKRQVYMNSHFPFYSTEFKNDIHYPVGLCPTAERMYEKELILTTIFQPPNTRPDIDKFIKKIEKIEKNLDLLKAYEEKN